MRRKRRRIILPKHPTCGTYYGPGVHRRNRELNCGACREVARYDHGTRYAYRYGCRCELCKQAERFYRRSITPAAKEERKKSELRYKRRMAVVKNPRTKTPKPAKPGAPPLAPRLMCQAYLTCGRYAHYEFRSRSGQTVIPLCRGHAIGYPRSGKRIYPLLWIHRMADA